LALEGIVSKRRDAPYRSGRGPAWIKVKNLQREDFVVVGFTDPEGGRVGFGALLVGYHTLLGELVYAATGMGCYWNGRRASVSKVARMDQATLLMTDIPSLYQYGRGAAYEQLSKAAAYQRTWGDCYGHILVATGRAEIMLDAIMNVWDCGPLLPILREAGGTFTDWKGEATIRGGNAISTNGALFEPVMKVINEAS